ncbi:hypothetical protein PA598K_07279, partial [Paenibacillus sp. 598K]|uniref:hypothetical protein n=1 Tax=Paenibacillus sp. 598K TaxID=1117987 RepID=UPI000FF9686E
KVIDVPWYIIWIRAWANCLRHVAFGHDTGALLSKFKAWHHKKKTTLVCVVSLVFLVSGVVQASG